jgi:hypothetical protein
MVVRADFARKLERELITVTAQRDEAVNNYETAQLLSIRVGEQRDRLAELLRSVIDDDGTPISIYQANEALQSLTPTQPNY